MAKKKNRSKEAGAKHRETMARRMREQSHSVADIGPIPKPKNPRRKAACRLDLKRFLVTYFPNSTGLSPFSADHDRVIAREQKCVLEGGRFVNAVYRGFAKTSIGEGTAIWAILYGHRRFVALFGADSKAAGESMESIQLELEGNDLLYEDFPEACHAVRALDGKPQRATGQHFKGKRTYIEWTAERLVMPRVPKSKASGGVIVTRGVTAGFRGLKKKLPDGTQQRPDFILGDDPQTDESAGTPLQVAKTLALFRKGITKLGGHRKQLAIVVNATVIQQDDAIDKLLADPAWQGERIPLVIKWADAHKTLWLDQYAKLRRGYDAGQVGAQHKAWAAATAFYRANRAAMDAGAQVSWESCFDPEHEISALQHAYNALIDDGEEAFASEFQQRPLPRIAADPGELTAAEIMARVNGAERGRVPLGCNRLTAFVDVHGTGSILYWLVAAWGEGFGGAVVDYGTFPRQSKSYFAASSPSPSLVEATRIPSLEGSLYAGLKAVSDELLAREWPLQGAAPLKVERILVDSGWGFSTEVVERFCAGYRGQLLASKGMGIGAAKAPIADWAKKPGEQRGPAWIIRLPAPGAGRKVLFDANHWKSFCAARLRQPMGEPTGLSLFGDEQSKATHQLFADHCCAEYKVTTSGRGRDLQEWVHRPGKPDNHWWDCLVGCAVAASIAGVQPAGVPGPQARPKRASIAEMQRRARDRERRSS